MRFLRICLSIALLFLLVGCETGRHVVIDAPLEEVWAYVADSHNAAEWSVYFDHITPLPGSPDGGVGARRRCFRRPDETGNTWDEDVVELEPLRYRQIHTYNLRGFPTSFGRPEFRVHQRFTRLQGNRTRLSFSSELITPTEPAHVLRFLGKAREGNRVIGLNLLNIKAAVEARQRGVVYHRPYLWESYHPWDQ